jgi:hypothetical protein
MRVAPFVLHVFITQSLVVHACDYWGRPERRSGVSPPRGGSLAAAMPARLPDWVATPPSGSRRQCPPLPPRPAVTGLSRERGPPLPLPQWDAPLRLPRA